MKISANVPVVIPVVTIDGPGGSGKGTISQLLAQQLKWHFLDSGAIYRILALVALEKNIDSGDETTLVTLAANLNIQFKSIDEKCRIFLSTRDITNEIRAEKCGEMASKIAVLSAVRVALLNLQRNFRQLPGLVADGRDMGTVVFPDAMVKIFLTATSEERAKRRYIQLKSANRTADLQKILIEIQNRDARDENRLVAPLKPAKDAIVVDTTNLTIVQVVAKIMDVINSIRAKKV